MRRHDKSGDKKYNIVQRATTEITCRGSGVKAKAKGLNILKSVKNLKSMQKNKVHVAIYSIKQH